MVDSHLCIRIHRIPKLVVDSHLCIRILRIPSLWLTVICVFESIGYLAWGSLLTVICVFESIGYLAWG